MRIIQYRKTESESETETETNSTVQFYNFAYLNKKKKTLILRGNNKNKVVTRLRNIYPLYIRFTNIIN